MTPPVLSATARTTLKRQPDRGSHDRAVIRQILDEGLICDLAFAKGDKPYVIPTAYGRIGDQLYLHGSSANRALRSLRDGGEACVTVTLLDGLVLGRSAFHQSMNFRSAILYGRLREVDDASEKLEALRAIVEHVVPGRWQDVRGPNTAEFQRTLVLALAIEEGSAKLRNGPPIDEEEDYALACWAGVIPLRVAPGEPQADPRLREDTPPPSYALDYRRPGAES